MRNNLRTKLIAMFMVLILGSFVIISSILFWFLGDYYTKREGATLSQSADRIAEMTVEMLSGGELAGLFSRIYRLNIESYSQNTGAHIVVFDQAGNVVEWSTSVGDQLMGHSLPQALVAPVLQGEHILSRTEFGAIFGSTVIVAGSPMEQNGDVTGGVFCILPTPYLDELRLDVLEMIMLSMVLTLFIAFIMSYVFARYITTPLKQMRDMAKSIAKGNFSERITSVGDDEIGELAASFNEMTQALDHLEQTRSSFISNVSHELRTPMTIIIGFLEGIADGTVPAEKRREYLSIVIQEVRRLSRLVNDLLALSRMESGSKKVNKTAFDINEELRRGIIRFEQSITDKNLHVRIAVGEQSCMVNADRDDIVRVITNLIDNAVKFTPEGGDLFLQVDTRGKKAYVSVKNSGEGIRQEELQYIWDRFYKTDKSRSSDKKGVGLGLYIVKSIIRANGEDIWASSREGEYTMFTFTVERAREKYKEARELKPSSDSPHWQAYRQTENENDKQLKGRDQNGN